MATAGPSNPGNNIVELWILFPDPIGDKHVLSVPIDECQRKSTRPLTWLCFIGSIIYGRDGTILDSRDGQAVDYNVQIAARRYYFFSNADALLLDPDAMDDRTSASTLSTTRAGFRQTIVDRDGTCVVTGEAAMGCDACHLLPHSKGPDYIANFANYRQGSNVGWNDINDLRNGLLLVNVLHRYVGLSTVAFLQTPNFIMRTDDVLSTVPLATPPPPTRLTVHYFNLHSNVVPLFAPENSDVQIPPANLLAQWPPRSIFDFIYGCAVLKAWGTNDFMEWLRINSKPFYYGSGGSGGGRGNNKDPKLEKEQELQERKEEQYEMVDMQRMLLSLWQSYANGTGGEPSSSEIEKSRNKVDAWLQSSLSK